MGLSSKQKLVSLTARSPSLNASCSSPSLLGSRLATIADYASSVQFMATLLRIVPKVGEPPDPGSASHFAFDGVERVVQSWQTLQSPSFEGLSSVDDGLLPRSEGELHEALREGDLQAVKLQNATTQQVEKIKAQVTGSKLNQFERARTMSTSTLSTPSKAK